MRDEVVCSISNHYSNCNLTIGNDNQRYISRLFCCVIGAEVNTKIQKIGNWLENHFVLC